MPLGPDTDRRPRSSGAPSSPRALVRDPQALAAHALRIAQRTAFGVLGDHAAADDVAQEVAIIAVRRIGSLRDPEALNGWLHRIAVRRALYEGRRQSDRRRAEIASYELHQRTRPAAGHRPEHDAEVEAAAALLVGLPLRQRAALTLRYVHDLDDAAIAAALECRQGTVRSLLSRGLAALRDRQLASPPPPPSASTPAEEDSHE